MQTGSTTYEEKYIGYVQLDILFICLIYQINTAVISM